ncbi:4'-phosphopantetheinyl transferase [Marinobacter sp. HN1S83]|uniref:4'-phosphopantetheinyl transferase family protein n=1 Tax=Marinobacter sp. HN1S83 TaxID=3382301 RepID=UPI00387B39C4
MTPFITPCAYPLTLPSGFDQYWCKYNRDGYRDSLYPTLGIPFPASLNRAVAKRRAEFLAGRYCARKALSALGLGREPVEIGPHGCPLWPRGVKGSISHSRAWACALVSTDPKTRSIGVDIENIVSEETLEQSRDLVLVREEHRLLGCDNLNPRTVFTLLFSLKESFFKSAYPLVGHYFDFDAVTVVHIDTHRQIISFQLNEQLHAQLPKYTDFQAHYRFLDEDTLATLTLLPGRSS